MTERKHELTDGEEKKMKILILRASPSFVHFFVQIFK
jgi:hypothetical protein